MTKTFKSRHWMLCLFLVMGSLSSWAQVTIPASFDLSLANFSFTTQVASSTSYPANMQGWETGTNGLTTITANAPGGDQPLVGSASAGTEGLGNLGVNGFNFLRGQPNGVKQVGAVAVGLNTSGRYNIVVSWLAADQTAGSAGAMNLTLQYRISGNNTGTFTTVANSTYTSTSNGQGAAQVFTVALPAACENQATKVQLRWIYYGSAGTEDAIRLDDISVTSTTTATPDYRSKASGNYSDPSIWEYPTAGGVYATAINAPTSANSINISSGNVVTLDGSVSIDAGKSLILDGKLAIGSNTLTINGNVIGSGFLQGSPSSNMVIGGTGALGTLIFDQTTDGTTNVLNNFTMNRTSSGTATLGNKMVLTNVYTPTAGVLASGGFLNLRSTATNTARIAPGSTAGGYITGNVVTERYISGIGRYGNASAYNRAYRMLAPMVTTSTTIKANWQEGQTNTDVNTIVNTRPGYGTQITGSGGAANGFDPTITNQTSLYTFNPATQAWAAATNTNVATLDAKKGYLLYMRGDRSIDMTSAANPLPSTNTTLRTTGSLQTGDQSFTGLEGNSRFSLVSNPFASPISWASVNTTNTANFISTYYYWDANIGTRGGFVSVNNIGITSPSGTANTVNIQSGQAFFVRAQASAVSPTLVINESHKSTTNNIDVFRTGSTEMLVTSLYFNDANGRGMADGVVSVYDNAYSAAVDGDDAEQMANWDEDVAIARSGSLLSIEMRPLIDVADTIFLQIARLKQQPYQWQFDPSNFNAPGLQAFLQDSYLATETPVSLSAQTLIDFTVNADAASSAANRFRIVFRSSAPLPVKMTSVKASDKQTAIQVEWNTVSESAMDKYIVEKSTDGREFGAIGTVMAKNTATATTYTWLDADRITGGNYYRIRSVGKDGQVSVSEVVRVMVGKGKDEITVYPNPVAGDVVAIQLNNVANGRYSMVITNQLGQQVFVKSFDHAGGSASQTISLPKAITPGVYQLQVIGDNVKYDMQIIKK